MLSVDSVTKKFGGLLALNNVSVKIEDGEIYGIIGPNGSGKSTLINVVTGVLKPNEGRITYNGTNLTAKSPHYVSRLGIGRTFQIPRVFPDLTVAENLEATMKSGSSLDKILELVDLDKFSDTKAKHLGYGQKKQLELARVIGLNSKLVFLDEPFAGLDLAMIQKVSSYLSILNKELDKTIVVIEHHLEELMELVNYIFVLHHGQKIEEGDPSRIKDSPAVFDAYFGK